MGSQWGTAEDGADLGLGANLTEVLYDSHGKKGQRRDRPVVETTGPQYRHTRCFMSLGISYRVHSAS